MLKIGQYLALGATIWIIALAQGGVRAAHAQSVDIGKIQLPAEIKASGVLKVAGDASFPPVFYLDKNNEFRGLDVDLIAAVAKVLGLRAVYINAKTEGLLGNLQSKRVDVGMSGLIDRPIREKSFDFVNYIKGTSSLLVQAGNPTGINAENICGKSIAVGKGTAADISVIPELAHRCVQDGKPPVKSSPYPDYTAAVLAVRSGRVPASLTIDIIQSWVVTHSNGKLEQGASVPGKFLMGIAVEKNHTELVNALSAALSELMRNGTYARILEKYGMTRNAIPKPQINLPADMR